MSSRDTIRACDRQTDRQTDTLWHIYRASIASCSNKSDCGKKRSLRACITGMMSYCCWYLYSLCQTFVVISPWASHTHTFFIRSRRVRWFRRSAIAWFTAQRPWWSDGRCSVQLTWAAEKLAASSTVDTQLLCSVDHELFIWRRAMSRGWAAVRLSAAAAAGHDWWRG